MGYIFSNGSILNSAKGCFEAKSLLVEGDSVRYLGSLSECRKAATKAYDLIDLKKRLLLPAFTDAHTHFVEYAKARILVNLSSCNSVVGIEENLCQYRDTLTWKPEWILGGSWDRNLLDDPLSLNCHFIDRIFPTIPVALLSKDYHSILLNSLALRLAGITKNTADPLGGRIERDSEGEPTGILFETAIDPIWKIMVQPSESQIEAAIKAAIEDMYVMGLTGFHSMESSASRELLLRVQAKGVLFRFCWHFMLEDFDKAKREFSHSYEGTEWYKPGGLKLFGDGSLGSQTAAMFEPYDDDSIGILRHSAEEMLFLMQEAAEHGFSTTIHAIGNRCVAQVIDCAILMKDLSEKKNLTQRIEHVQSIRREDIPRLKASGLLASVQPIHLANDVPMIHKHWNKVEDQVYAFGSMLRAGIPVAFGSDAPIESLNPFLGIHTAIERRHQLKGELFMPSEALSPVQAILAYSDGSAKASQSEGHRGSIVSGKLADLIVIDDYREQNRDFWLQAGSKLTMVNGVVVHSLL